MKKKTTTATINGEYLANLFEQKAEEILAKEKAPKKKATKKVTEKSEVKEPKKKTVKATKKADTEKVVKDEKITKKPATKKVTKKAEKPAKEQAEKPKKVTKKAKAEVEQEQEKTELRKISKSIKVAKTTYDVVENITSYESLLEAVENGEDVVVAFDCSEVSKKDYGEIFHVPYVNMKDSFDICSPIFIGEKVPRLVFASIYSEALWDLFPEEFDLVSAVLVEKKK